jgi:signal transduction histidine kinase
MLEYYLDAVKLIRSKIGKRIGILVFIQIFFIVISLVILSYYQSLTTYLGNSINIAGKNRFLTSNLIFSITEYFLEKSDISKIDNAIDQLESNILTLKQGGTISGIDLKPLPSEFSTDWDNVYQKWISLKTIITKNVLKQNQIISPIVVVTTPSFSLSTSALDKNIKTTLEAQALSLVDSSNVLVTKLGEFAKNSSQNSLFLQGFFALLNLTVTTVFVLYLARKILKPIFALITATYEVRHGNLNVLVKSKVNDDELSFLIESFNSMVASIKNYIKKQNELQKEIEKANEELKYKDQLKDEFINVAAHELRNPIQPILGLSELLRTKEIENIKRSREIDIEKIENILDIIIRNSKRLMQLEEDILDVARIETGNLILKKETINLNEMITEILREYEQKMIQNKKNLKLFYESHNNDEIIIAAGDRNRLIQVVSNLLNNGIKFTNEGNITIIVERKKDNSNNNNEIVVSIKDTGTGVDQQILPKLFTKFATKSTAEGGTGLGLFISKTIIEKHGGRIWAMNNATTINGDGKGATFAFSLPITK